MQHRAEEKGLQFTNSYFDPEIAPVLLGDPYRLNQVLLNLVSNAIKFTREGVVDITCLLLKNSQHQQTLYITVLDSGIGMDPAFAQKLFEKFTQEDSSITRKYGGTGLGMSICKELVELMGGNIQVTSKKGEGTAVALTLPMDRGTGEQLPSKEIEQVDTSIIAGKRILVTDDNELNRLVASGILSDYKADVVEAENGSDAVSLVDGSGFDLVLMGIQMPVMDGIEATKLIRHKIGIQLPVIALTAYAITGDNQKCLDAGMDDYLSKPFEEQQLLAMVCKWLKKKELASASVIKNEASLYSLKNIYEIAGGNNKYIVKLIVTFVDQTELSLEEIKDALHKKTFLSVKNIAHKMVSSVSFFEINSVVEVLREIERLAAKGNDFYETLFNLIGEMERVLLSINRELKQVSRTMEEM